MIPLASPSRAREADRITIEDRGIPSLVLMEAAGCGVFYAIRSRFPVHRTMDLLVGKGNNGGDALVVGRLAVEAGHDVRAYLFREKLSPDATFQLERYRRAGGRVLPLSAYTPRRAVVVDGLFGTGFQGTLPEEILTVLERIPEDAPRVAVDIPSGVNGATGEGDQAFRADLTVTFSQAKPGHFLFPGRTWTGELVVVPIGLDPEGLALSIHRVVEAGDVAAVLPRRKGNEHKGQVGRVLVFSGRKNFAGAVIHTAWGALRAGAGLVFVGVPEAIYPVVSGAVPPAVVFAASRGETLSGDAVTRALAYAPDVVVAGPGLGRDPHLREVLLLLLERFTGTVVLDADALVLLRDHPVLRDRDNLILTPHPGEMAHLLQKLTAREVDRRRMDIAETWAREARSVLVLKGAPTLTAGGGTVYWNPTGNPGMATGGTGDVLAGVVAAFAGQSMDPVQAAWAGVWVHGKAGDRARDLWGSMGLTAREIADEVAHVLQEFGR